MLFDPAALAAFRARAATRGGSFLDERIWAELAEAVALLHRKPARALLLGPPTPAATRFECATGIALTDDLEDAGAVDLLLAVRWAESEDDLPEKLAALAILLPPNTPVLGASIGGDSLRALRGAMVTADREEGAISARTHPRLEPAAFAELLQRAGFAQPVVDVDPVDVRYSSAQRLVADLRDLGASNALADRIRKPLTRAWRRRLDEAFPPGTVERFDILHFSAWTAAR